jgi:hypothetical protein
MSSQAIAAVQPKTATLFEFVSETWDKKITFYPVFSVGPVVPGQEPGPLFHYDGPEGKLIFRGSQVIQQDGPLGKLVTVVIKPQQGAGSTAFLLFLPNVSLGPFNAQAFTTYGIRADHSGNIEAVGARTTYRMECFNGLAKAIASPM